jgi:hypothetical protein
MRMARVAALSVLATMSPAHAADDPLSLAETLRLAVAESPDLAARARPPRAPDQHRPAGALPIRK